MCIIYSAIKSKYVNKRFNVQHLTNHPSADIARSIIEHELPEKNTD